MKEYQSTLTFITESLPGFTVDVPYNFTLEAVGGVPPYEFALTQGEFPDGVNLSASGTISGTATVAGDTTAFVKLSDSEGAHLTQAFDCQISDLESEGN